MKPFNLVLSFASVCLILAGCSKSDTIAPKNSLTIQEGIPYSSMPKTAFVAHKPGLYKAEFLTSNQSKREGMTIVYLQYWIHSRQIPIVPKHNPGFQW